MSKKMRASYWFFVSLIIIGVVLMLTSCATEKNYFGSETTFGIKIGLNSEKIPTIYLGYIRSEGAAVNENTELEFNRQFEDISLFTGEGSGTQNIKFKNSEVPK